VGWADAQEGGSQAVRYLIDHLPATKFAELDPEEFYDFTAVRPHVSYTEDGERILKWPSNEFFYWSSEDGSRELILFLGTEPSLKWRTYTQTLLSVVEPYDMQLMINAGSLLDALPHTRDATLTGSANKEELKVKLEGVRIRRSTYQGPVGVTSAFMEACTKAGLDYVSLMGHASHYVQRGPNYKVSKAIVHQINEMLSLNVSLEELEELSKTFEEDVTKSIRSSVEVSAYVKRLERQYDGRETGEELPTPESAVEGVEQFLRDNPPPDGQPGSSN
jgi:proteasome assembly chaperone (PAC2) family protein